MEAIQSFGGNSLDNVLQGAKRKVAKTLDSCRPVAKKKDDPPEESDLVDEVEEVCPVSSTVMEKENLVSTQ
jgi:hypothetical protein